MSNVYAGTVADYSDRKSMSQFRIVRERRGDLITGFRVQIEKYNRHASTDREWGPYWANIGRKLYTEEAAREYRTFLERLQRTSPKYDVID